MLEAPSRLINITGSAGQSLTRDQQKFNRLIGQISQRRAQLMAWEAALPRCTTIYAQRVHPLDEQIRALHRRAPVVLDEAHGMKGLSRSVRKQLSKIIVDMIARMPESASTPELKALYNRHSGTDFDEDRAEDEKLMKEMFGALTGVELDDDLEFDSPDEMFEHAARKVTQQQDMDEGAAAHRSGRKKTAKQIAKEAARASEEKSITQTVREVYRKLASTLHPDRESDPAERTRKTDLMQRANDAYTQGNLLQLLELQWELEQIDPAALGRLPAQKLKHYLRVLKDQLEDLDAELRDVEIRTLGQFHLQEHARINPATLARTLEQEAVRKANMVRGMKEELELFKHADAIQAFVRAYREQARDAMAEFPF